MAWKISTTLPTSRPIEYAHGVVAEKPSKTQDPTLINALHDLLEDITAGDPSSGMKWTHKSLRQMVAVLRRRGYSIGRTTLRRLLQALK